VTSKSERTKARIMDAARSEFSRVGYQGATVRAIASEARIDPSMIIRYFHSKAGLFDAVCEISLRLPSLADIPRDQVGAALVRHYLSRWEGEVGDDSLVLLLRSSAVDQEAAAAEVYQQMTQSGDDLVVEAAEAASTVALAYTDPPSERVAQADSDDQTGPAGTDRPRERHLEADQLER